MEISLEAYEMTVLAMDLEIVVFFCRIYFHRYEQIRVEKKGY